MNAPVRIAKALLKAVTTAAAHQAKDLGLSSTFTRADYAYGGLLNTSFSYGDFMTRQTDEPVSSFEDLPAHQLGFITEAHDIAPTMVRDAYEMALKLVTITEDILEADYGFGFSVSEVNAPLTAPLTEVSQTDEEAIQPESTADAPVETEKPPVDEAEEWNNSPSVAELPKMPKNIAIGLGENGVLTYSDMAKLDLEELVSLVRNMAGGKFHTKKCDEWLEIAKQHGVSVQ